MATSRKTDNKHTPWYKNAVIYQLHVKAFADSNGDGIGDFKGLRTKLDYLSDLGVTAIWLLPFYPSPLRDDGYDIAKYTAVHPSYGNLRDAKEFIREAHKRGMQVITELVMNHTSDQHPWFQASRDREKPSPYKDFYVWNDNPEKYQEARIIFTDFETSNWAWDPKAQSYYWHRFYSHQPDLNFENPAVQKAMMGIVDFWMEAGVDGLRLDAVPYLFEKEGTNCENLPETHAFLKKLRTHVDEKFQDRMLLAEANQWPADAVKYFGKGKGDECHMAFHFPLMPRMFMAMQMEDRFPIVDILETTPAIPQTSQWATFLRNHDELTLEMVTDEERDYMYRMYAKDARARINVGIRRRLAPLLGNDRRKIELLNVLLFTLPGTPVVYYGDEIGMGDNYYLGDRNGVRTPMQWSADLNAGFSRANPQQLYFPTIIDPEYHYETVNVENQLRNSSSLLWWMKRIIAIHKRFSVFGEGNIEFLLPDNKKILAFVRKNKQENILVVANLSRYPQATQLDLSAWQGSIPQEVFGSTAFPEVGREPYSLTLAPYGYFIFSLERQKAQALPSSAKKEHEFRNIQTIADLFAGKTKDRVLPEILAPWLATTTWFMGKGRKIDQMAIKEVVPVETAESLLGIRTLFLEISYKEGQPELYIVPVALASGVKARQIQRRHPESIIANLKLGKTKAVLFDATHATDWQQWLLRLAKSKKAQKGKSGKFVATMQKGGAGVVKEGATGEVVHVGRENTVIAFQKEWVAKLYRRAQEGVRPEIEIGLQLQKAGFQNKARLLAEIQYVARGSEPMTIAAMEEFVPNQGDAWALCREEATRYAEYILSSKDQLPGTVPLENADEFFSTASGEAFREQMALLGKRVGEFHLALLKEKEKKEFKPEVFGYIYQVALSQFMNSSAKRVLATASQAKNLPEEITRELQQVIASKAHMSRKFQDLQAQKIQAVTSRIHGDFHLGEILFTGKDFAITDYEGNPEKSLSEKRLKRSPLFDVAALINSLYTAAYTPLLEQKDSLSEEEQVLLETWFAQWHSYYAGIFLAEYRATTKNSGIVPENEESFSVLLQSLLLTRALQQLDQELRNPSNALLIPVKRIQQLLA